MLEESRALQEVEGSYRAQAKQDALRQRLDLQVKVCFLAFSCLNTRGLGAPARRQGCRN
jgi:hypothetical protein